MAGVSRSPALRASLGSQRRSVRGAARRREGEDQSDHDATVHANPKQATKCKCNMTSVRESRGVARRRVEAKAQCAISCLASRSLLLALQSTRLCARLRGHTRNLLTCAMQCLSSRESDPGV